MVISVIEVGQGDQISAMNLREIYSRQILSIFGGMDNIKQNN
jgi:hypothetical protein